MLPVYVQQQPAGAVWYNDGVVIAERANGVMRYDSRTQAWVGVGGVTSRCGANCGFQQLCEVVLCDVNACVLKGPGVPIAALPLLEKHLPVCISKNSCLVVLLDALPYVQPTDISAFAFRERRQGLQCMAVATISVVVEVRDAALALADAVSGIAVGVGRCRNGRHCMRQSPYIQPIREMEFDSVAVRMLRML